MQRKAMVNFTTSIPILSILILSLLQFSCSQNANHNVRCIDKERRALLQFRNSLIDESNRLSSWSGEDCCSWKGVGCNESTGHVVKLDQYTWLIDGFQGEINSSLLALKHLNYLDLSGNNFSAIPIPVFFGSLKNLKYLNLSSSGFWGNIPHELGNLSHLQHLDLSSKLFSSNHLTAKSISWVAKLSSLKSLDLSYANLHESQDWFQSLNMLPSLISLKLEECELPFLPNLPHANLTSLSLLDLSWNFFNSIFPVWLSNVTSLEHLDLSANNFSGNLTSLGLLCNLTSLTSLDLSGNHFQGSIPRKICCLRQLVELRLNLNQLGGSVPSNIGLMTNLEVLDISSNSLVGNMSEVHFAKLKKLKDLRLYSNSLTLKVRSSWIPLFQLQYMIMDDVRIGPHFPSWLQTQKNLKQLRMRNSSIVGEIPHWFEINSTDIEIFDLSFNNITGIIPKFIDFRSHDGYNSPIIFLSSNKFEATSSQFPYDTRHLDLSSNIITTPILESICHLRILHYLDLSNNQLSGRLPMCFGNLRYLKVLKLGNNRLHGQIPSSLGNIVLLSYVVLNKNKFDGKLPLSMQHLTQMLFLDLSENELEGIIPSWIGKHLSELRILTLQSNHFYGDVPVHLCKLSKLQVLNLAHNNLTGSIPGCFNNFAAMGSNYSYMGGFVTYEPYYHTPYKVEQDDVKLHSVKGGRECEYSGVRVDLLRSLDLSQNNIVGGIPNELMDLVGLQSLRLSHNHLSENIPEKIGNLRHLETLDLSMNELSGSIPPSLANLHFLSYLNLSTNKLTGRIPMGYQLQTLGDPSIYAGNNGLCGKPLSNSCSYEKSDQETEPSIDEKEFNFSWFCAGLGPGFATGLLLIFCILFFKKSWRIAYFQFVENFSNNIWVWSVLNTSKLRRKLP